MKFEEAVAYLFEKLAPSKIMALASSVNNHVMVRNVSCLIYDEAIYFKTDKNFRKTKQGLVVEEEGRRFETLYKKYLWGSYNAYSHEEDEILVEIKPTFVEIWDTDDRNYAFQMFIDFEQKTVEIKKYDQD